jgi:hypothetical protein
VRQEKLMSIFNKPKRTPSPAEAVPAEKPAPKIELPSAMPKSVSRGAPVEPATAPSWHGRAFATSPASDPLVEAFYAQKVWVEIGDLIHRLPKRVVTQGPVNRSLRIWFKVGELVRQLDAGQVTVKVGRIAGLSPELFNEDLDLESETEVIFPWHRVLPQIEAIAPPRLNTAPPATRVSFAPRDAATPGIAAPGEPLPPAGSEPVDAVASAAPVAAPAPELPPPIEPATSVAELRKQVQVLRSQLESALRQRDEAVAQLAVSRREHQKRIALLEQERDSLAEAAKTLANPEPDPPAP